MIMSVVRDDRGMFKTTLYAALCSLAFASLSFDAAAADDTAAAAPSVAAVASTPDVLVPTPNLPASKPGVEMMAPIPDPMPAATTEAADPGSTGERAQGEKNCLTTAIYFEARGENTKGQKAVAEVILARARTPGRPKTICGVVYEGSQRKTGCQFSFTCDRWADLVRDRAAWKRARRVATAVMRTRGKVRPVARGATYYHASYVTPSWASHMVKVAQIGSHIFYRP